MRKIPTLFVRDLEYPERVTEVVTPGCEWVLSGEGRPTVKKDGTNVRVTVIGGVRYILDKRRNPSRAEKAQGIEPSYVFACRKDPADQYIWRATDATDFSKWPDGKWSCEALGEKIQGGVEGPEYRLYPFSWQPDPTVDNPRSFEEIRRFLSFYPMEGIVWHHRDGRQAKVKRRDFGLPWPAR